MNKLICGILAAGFVFCPLRAQLGDATVIRDIKTPLMHVFDPMQPLEEPWISLGDLGGEMPMPGGLNEALSRKLDAERMAFLKSKPSNRSNYTGRPTDKAALSAKIELGFLGRTGSGTPNDNHVAVGNNGYIVSVLNTQVHVFNDTGKLLKTWTLENFGSKAVNDTIDNIPKLVRTYDPRVVYDPVADRFITLFMEGTTDKTSYIIVAFSQTNKPDGKWNVYKIPGAPIPDTVWSDYPIVSQTADDLFFTVNLLANGTSWEEGFREAVIWQLDKKSGFAGDTLRKNFFHNIKYNNVPLWSICPIQNGPLPGGTDNYFITVRPYSTKNDSVFLQRVNGTQRSGQATFSMQLLKLDQPYGNPPSALQKDTAFKLRTNDARVLSGIRLGTTIHFMQNCMNFATKQAHITHNKIYNIGKPEAFARFHLITDDSIDMGYPAIAAAGTDEKDPAALITMVYTSPYEFPGVAAIYHNRYNEYSNIMKIKKGESLIYYSFIDTNFQRWGDYEGIQPKYNEPGVFYLVGSYGRFGLMYAWIARVRVKDSLRMDPIGDIRVFPIPARDLMHIELQTAVEGTYTASLYSTDGKLQRGQIKMFIPAGTHLLKFDASHFAPGLYVLKVLGPDGTELLGRKIVLE